MLGANAAWADLAAARGLAQGAMAKLILHEAARALPEVGLTDAQGAPASLAHYRGQWLVVNFWATWCAPCREEMPSLQALQQALPGLAVVPVATGPNPVPAIERFYAEAGITELPVRRDPESALARAMGVMGLPVTVIVDPEGNEVARLIGGADWAAPEALALMQALMR